MGGQVLILRRRSLVLGPRLHSVTIVVSCTLNILGRPRWILQVHCKPTWCKGLVRGVGQLINQLGSILVDLAAQISIQIEIVLPFVEDKRLARV